MAARTLQDPAERFLDGFTLGDVIITRGRTIEAADIDAAIAVMATA